MTVTIDGPAGAGKSRAARELARRLGFDFLDTGSMYRAVAYAALRDGVDDGDEHLVSPWLLTLQLNVIPGVVMLNGDDITGRIRTPEITAVSSRLAALPSVRGYLVRIQRQIAIGRNLVTEGRDQGTVVFPDAECKFFLVADRLERARRRYRELQARGVELTLEEVLSGQDERDGRDAGRDLAPMVPAATALILDSTNLTPEQVVERMESEVRKCLRTFPLSSTRSVLGPPS